MSLHLMKRPVDVRTAISSAALELTLAEAIKNSSPDCAAFVGVFVEPVVAELPSTANWGIRGVKFGKANRDKANEALATIVERMQGEFDLSDEFGETNSDTDHVTAEDLELPRKIA